MKIILTSKGTAKQLHTRRPGGIKLDGDEDEQ